MKILSRSFPAAGIESTKIRFLFCRARPGLGIFVFCGEWAIFAAKQTKRTMTSSNQDPRSAEVFAFLRDIAVHNDREWFKAHRARYDSAAAAFNDIVAGMIARIAEFEPGVAGLSPADCTYRIYRDIRFTNDKRPYKLHFGAYINAHGKKAMHGGYYLHFQPGNSLAAGGAYCLSPKVLREVRQSIVDNVDEFAAIVEAPEFKRLFPEIGEQRLKTVPKGFPKDFPHPEYLRPKDYSVFTRLDDAALLRRGWEDGVAGIFRAMKPMLDFVNYTIDDYE